MVGSAKRRQLPSRERYDLGRSKAMGGMDSGHRTANERGTQAQAGEDYELAQRLSQLPAYARSLLRIEVPVVVTLATTRQPVSRVLELAPGTILHFTKACDDPLTVSVGNCDVAVGETVKVGDKFGLKVTSMVMPAEKFEQVGRNSKSRKT